MCERKESKEELVVNLLVGCAKAPTKRPKWLVLSPFLGKLAPLLQKRNAARDTSYEIYLENCRV